MFIKQKGLCPGVTLTYNLSMSSHIDNIITGCARVLYGLRTLRSHGMPPPALHAVFQSTALAEVTSAAPAWWVSLTPWIEIYLPVPAATVISFHVTLVYKTKMISFIVYHVVVFCRLSLLTDVSICISVIATAVV